MRSRVALIQNEIARLRASIALFRSGLRSVQVVTFGHAIVLGRMRARMKELVRELAIERRRERS